MCAKKKKTKRIVRRFDMEHMILRNEFSLKKFIEKNKAKIETLAPLNPSIPQNDEWRDELYDKLYKDVDKK